MYHEPMSLVQTLSQLISKILFSPVFSVGVAIYVSYNNITSLDFSQLILTLFFSPVFSVGVDARAKAFYPPNSKIHEVLILSCS